MKKREKEKEKKSDPKPKSKQVRFNRTIEHNFVNRIIYLKWTNAKKRA